jgi:hypothetical protein
MYILILGNYHVKVLWFQSKNLNFYIQFYFNKNIFINYCYLIVHPTDIKFKLNLKKRIKLHKK